jgi:type I site-specific restriction endonuclease
MATGPGKTFTAFQIIYRLWKSRTVKRVLFLADRDALINQTRNNDFRPFGDVMTRITNRTVDTSYEVYLSLYQAITGPEDHQKTFRRFSPDFFDLVVIDECHRGSAREDSAWREILEYFDSAIHLGLTATPKETEYISNVTYFGEPIYTYSLRQGIDDGFLAPYKVVRITMDKDDGWRPDDGMTDQVYELPDFDGDPEVIYEPDDDEDLDEPDASAEPERKRNDHTGSVGEEESDPAGDDPTDPATPRRRYIVDGVKVDVSHERVQYLDEHGNLITESLRDYTRNRILDTYHSRDEFLAAWRNAERKAVVIEELADRGVFLDALKDEVGSDYDDFDLVSHVAFDEPPKTRRERAARLRQSDYFSRYGETARAVIDAILDKYATDGVTSIEDTSVLKLPPISHLGSVKELVKPFGGTRDGFLQAIRELEGELYRDTDEGGVA